MSQYILVAEPSNQEKIKYFINYFIICKVMNFIENICTIYKTIK